MIVGKFISGFGCHKNRVSVTDGAVMACKKIAPVVKRFLADEDGAFLVEFGITFPVLILLSFGLMEFSLVVFDYQRAAEATRIGVRHTILNDAVANTTTLLNGSVITCTKPHNKVECVGGSPDDTAEKQFRNMYKEMRGIYPTLEQKNIIVSYQGTDVGEEDEFGGVFPMVTLQLVGVRHEMIVGHLIGIDYIEFPAFTTTVLGPGNYVNVAEQVKKKGNH